MAASDKIQAKLDTQSSSIQVKRGGELVDDPHLQILVKFSAFSTEGELYVNNQLVFTGTKTAIKTEADRIELLTEAELVAEFGNDIIKNIINP